MYKNKKIALVIPCYKVSKHINDVIKNVPNFIDKIYIVDDKCPESSVKYIKSKSRKIKKIFRNINGGVGAYSSLQELLKFFRDGPRFENLELVISLSGINDNFFE